MEHYSTIQESWLVVVSSKAVKTVTWYGLNQSASVNLRYCWCRFSVLLNVRLILHTEATDLVFKVFIYFKTGGE
jgi:hypothetical protein